MSSSTIRLLFLLIFLLMSTRSLSMCVHDHMIDNRVRRQAVEEELDVVNVDDIIDDVEESNDDVKLDDFYEPIRLKLWFDDDNIDFPCDSLEYSRLREQTQRAADKLSSFISVIPSKDPLLFARESICKAIWIYPRGFRNRRTKCAEMNPRYDGEKCIDEFQIPDDHLKEFEVFDWSLAKEGRKVYKNGTGVRDADTVLYIRAKQTDHCKHYDGAIAYASYCKLGLHNRPVAGYANFCPQYLKNELYNAEKLYLSALHEFIHALGFSKNLFDKYQVCRITGGKEKPQVTCRRRRLVLGMSSDNNYKLISPAVKREAARHFQCPTCNGVSLENTMNVKSLTSHWEMRVMHTSLMTAKMGLSHHVAMDPITLAALQDTGWYRINMSASDDFKWGKDEGCQFGAVDKCRSRNETFFCQPNAISTHGCHFSGFHRGTCETDVYLDGCYLYKANSHDACHNSKKVYRDGNTLSPTSRCFVKSQSPATKNQVYKSRSRRSLSSSPEDGAKEGMCYERRCVDDDQLQIKIGGSEWIDCPAETWVEVDGYSGAVWCPKSDEVCPKQRPFHKGYVVPACARISIQFPGLASIYKRRGMTPAEEFKAKSNILRRILSLIDVVIMRSGAKTVPPARLSDSDEVFFSLKMRTAAANRNEMRNCSIPIERLQTTIERGRVSVAGNGNQTRGKNMKMWHLTEPCPPPKPPTEKEEETEEEDEEDTEEEGGTKVEVVVVTSSSSPPQKPDVQPPPKSPTVTTTKTERLKPPKTIAGPPADYEDVTEVLLDDDVDDDDVVPPPAFEKVNTWTRPGSLVAWTVVTVCSSVMLSVAVLAVYKSMPPRSITPTVAESEQSNQTYLNDDGDKISGNSSVSPPSSVSARVDYLTSSSIPSSSVSYDMSL